MTGWVSLHRKIRCHPFYKERRKFSKFEAWIDLLLDANHADNEWIAGNEVILVKRGSLITSEVQLMERWRWSKSKVRAFLKLLEAEKMAVKKSDNKKTTIFIINYDNYQRIETAEKPTKDRKKTSKEPQKDTNNNINNDNNVIKEIVDIYNDMCNSLPKVKVITEARKRTLKTRLKSYPDTNTYIQLFKKAEKSKFLSGKNGKWTSCNFDWLINENNMIKVLEGNYDEKDIGDTKKNFTGATDEELYGGMQ